MERLQKMRKDRPGNINFHCGVNEVEGKGE